jgi:N-acetyl-gamma-glutamyl-phosphate reductase
MKPKIFIDGEHGTTGLQIRQRLGGRSDLDILSIPEAERRNADLREDLLKEADVAILCLPDDGARQAVAMLEGHNSTRIIDTSTANRVNPDWVYGFPELDTGHAEKIAGARLVANPGCYPTGAIALIRPLVSTGIVPADYPVTVNAISGYTGGGKQMIAQMEDAGREDHIASQHFLYGLTLKHKHVPELQKYALLERRPLFSPAVGRFRQGMLVQVPLHLSSLHHGASAGDIHAALAAWYPAGGLVEVVGLDETGQLARLDPEELAGTDRMKLFVFGGDGHVNLVASLDNLGKGASGAAVQNMDLMLGARR